MWRRGSVAWPGVVALLALCHAQTEARTWLVKPDQTGDAPTIVAAADSAASGDTILIAPGTYRWTEQGASGESMVRLAAGVSLRGMGNAETTILDAERMGRVVECFDAGEVRIEQLTIANGVSPFARGGGGIFAGPTSTPRITDCVIRDNLVSGQASGGGVACGVATISRCEIIDNRGGFDTSGGGIQCGAATITDCVIKRNSVHGDPGGRGGGITTTGGATIEDCWFEENVAGGPFSGRGGAVFDLGGSSIRGCVFVRNTANVSISGAARGGAVYFRDAGTITDCVFVENVARGSGRPGEGGAIAGTTGPVEVARSTFVANSSGLSLPAGGVVEACIVMWTEFAACDGSATYSCTNFFANDLGNSVCGTDGGGNFSADPEFCAVDPVGSFSFDLQEDSPCAPGNPRSGSCGLIGAAPVGCGQVVVRTATWSRVKSLYR